MKPKDRKKKRSGEKHPARKRSTSQSAPPAGKTDMPGKLARPEIRPPTGGTAVPVPVVGIGASAGGLEAFTQLLKHLPLDTGMGFVLVQHLDPDHESALTQILSRATALPVREITDNQPVEANHVYIIPRDTNLRIVQGLLKLEPRARTRTPHRPIDSYFESLAQDQHERAIGVVLSGTASDGTLGLEAIKAAGGITFAQDDSAKYDSMPQSAVAAGCVDLVLSPADIAKELARIAKHPYIAGQSFAYSPSSRRDKKDRADAIGRQDDGTPLPSGGHGTSPEGGTQARDEAGHGESDEAPSAANRYKKILLLLCNHCGVDFSLYKPSTIHRRIARRIALTRQETLAGYAGFLRGNAQELDSLFSDVLISVTSFFRNPETFEALQRDVLPKLLAQRNDDPIRCWVLGCSTGQEAYSLAISLTEAAQKTPRLRKLQIFATDLNEKLLEKARQGLYAKTLALDISPERLRQFFVEEEGGYRINKALRDMVVFARQNLIADPPFSRMDLISCRNLLIYLESSVQQKALPTFHYALRPHGFLVLGASESASGFTDLFEPVDRKHKIFSKKSAPTPAFQMPARKEQTERTPPRPLPPLPMRPLGPLGVEPPESVRGELNAQREADRIAVTQFAPPGVLINDDCHVLQFRGPTGAYLEPPAGRASFDVLKMAREGLMLPLRTAINKAKQGNKTVRTEHVRVTRDGVTRKIHVEVIPLKNLRERCFLVSFEDAEAPGGMAALPPARRKPAAPPLSAQQESDRLAELEGDLAETRDYLQTMQEQHEAANEELQASGEEVQSANEELQSINEELETSKEELESANEELTTLNEEMSNRNVELNRLNNDLVNLQNSTKLAIVLLGRDLTIRRFNPQAEKQFDLSASDQGRSIGKIRHDLVSAGPAESPLDLHALSADVIGEVREQEREARDKDGRWYSLRVRPYMTLDNKVDGAVLILVGIDSIKRSEQAATDALELAENTIDTVREPLLVLDAQLHVESANRAFYRTFLVTPSETIGARFYELGNGHWNVPRLRELLGQILPQRTSVEEFLIEHDFAALGRRAILLNARRIDDQQQQTKRILLAFEDITERKRTEEMRARLAAIVDGSDDAIIGKDLHDIITSWNQGAQQLFGYTAQETVGRPFSILLPPDHENEEPGILKRIGDGQSTRCDTIRRRKDGSLVDIALTVSPIKDSQDRIIGASTIARDMTERKQAEEVRARLAIIVESSDDAIISNDLDGVITSWNQGAERSLGYTTEEAIGSPISILLPPECRDEESRIIERLRCQEVVEHYDSVSRRKDGTLLEVSVAVSPLVDGYSQLIGASRIFRDISEHKDAQERLRQAGAELEGAVKAKTAELVQSHERLRAMATELNLTEQRERQKIAAELHDHVAQLLVLSKLKLGQSRRLTESPEKRDALMTEMDEVLSDALTYTRTLVVNLSPPILFEFGLPAAIKWLGEGMQRHALVVTVHIETEPPKLPDDQAMLLFQSIRELLMNAAKHAKSGKATVRLEWRSGELRIEVRDEGVGFDLAAPGTTTSSSKFGLFSIRERMRALGGRFELDSTPGQGTTATLALPVSGAAVADSELKILSSELSGGAIDHPPTAVSHRFDHSELTTQNSQLHQQHSNRIRVLLVDDHAMIRQGLRSVLESYPDLEVVGEACNGEQAVAAADALQPTVVLMDINMPKMNGIEATELIKARSPSRIVIGLSVNVGGANAEAMRQAGASMLLTKEAAVDELYMAIHTTVNGGHQA